MKKLLFAVLLLPIVVLAQGVYPTTAQSLKPMELGEAILLLMPDKGANSVNWDHRAESNILWLTEGWESRRPKENSIFRDGLMRIHVKGKVSTVLKKQKHELAWTVSYSSEGNPGLGVQEIEITPGMPKEGCFGSLNEGCAFHPQPSLTASGIRFKKLCENNGTQFTVIVFELTHPNRSATMLRWAEDRGSAGARSSVTLSLAPKAEELCKHASDRL